MKPELIVALDVPDVAMIEPILDRLPPEVDYFKVGLELYTAAGHKPLEILARRGKRIFLDLKFHDIPRTVANAVSSALKFNVALMTVHALGGRAMMRAAAEAAGSDGPRLVAVTTLTSLNADDFKDLGINRSVSEQALALGALALESGIHGLVTSVHEARALRERFGAAPILVTPGIRPAGADIGDQKRVATPAAAVKAGATCLVVGRPILEAVDPAAAARSILAEIAGAQG
jgi:orotidine-5'-phosphate decarboxylase